MESVVLLLFSIFTSGHCLSCLTCYPCDVETEVFSNKCSPIQDVCLSNNTENSVNLRCGQYQECDVGPLKDLSADIQRWINKQIKFEKVIEEKGTSIRCCKGDNCNKMFIKGVTVTTNDKENIVPEVVTNASINAVSIGEKSGISQVKIDHSSYIVPKLLKRDTMDSVNDDNLSSVSVTHQKPKSNKLDDDDVSPNSTNIATQTSDGTTEVTTDIIISGDLPSTSSGWSSQYWSFVTIELLIFTSLCNFIMFFMCLI